MWIIINLSNSYIKILCYVFIKKKKEQTYDEWYASCQPINWPEEMTKLFSSGDTFNEEDVKPKDD